MGACLSCLGLSSSKSTSAERQRLLDDSTYPNYNNGYQPVVPPNALSAEEQRAEREALNSITQWASDQIVEIFPHAHKLGASTTNGSGMTNSAITDGTNENGEGSAHLRTSDQAHQDILLSMIPGDKSKRGIRIYPASRPGSRSASKDALSIRSKGSNPRLKGKDSAVFVKLNVDLP